MALDEEFLKRVRPLYREHAGTEAVAQLLYAIVRMHRPQRLLEIGAGYTTNFLLRAIADNIDDVARERARIAESGNAHPTLRGPYYELEHRPHLAVIDTLDNPFTSARKAVDAARELGFGPLLTFHDRDFRGFSKELGDGSFDFVWFDCGGYNHYKAFMEEYFGRIDREGGLLLIHSCLTNSQGRRFLSELELEREKLRFELLSLLEPHKLRQNSVTLVRMIPRNEPIYSEGP